MSYSETVRQALQVLKTHEDTVRVVRTALLDAGGVPGWQDGGHQRWHARNEALLLKALNGPDEPSMNAWADARKRAKKRGVSPGPVSFFPGTNHFHARINKRAALKAHIDKCAVGGMIGIVESGRDCDCVEYVRPCEPIPATVYHFNKLEQEKAQWADGPFRLEIMTPAEAQGVESESRDLALEAFEDGHPHHIVSRFP